MPDICRTEPLSLQTTAGKGRSPGYVHMSPHYPLLPNPTTNHTHSRVKVTGACPSVAAMMVFVKSNIICHLFPNQSLCLQKPSLQLLPMSLSLHMSLQWTQLLFLSLCLLFFLFPFLALMQTPESYSLAHMGLLNRRAKGKKGRGSFSVKFADESLVNVVCEMDATVLHQRRKKERPLAPGHS